MDLSVNLILASEGAQFSVVESILEGKASLVLLGLLGLGPEPMNKCICSPTLCNGGIIDSPKLSAVGCSGTDDSGAKWIFAAFVFEIFAKPVGF